MTARREVSFAIALPPDWQGIDLLASEADQVLGAPLADALAAAARGSEHAQLLMLRSLVAISPAGEPLAAGLSVALADRSAPISHIPLSAESFGDAEISAASLPAGSGLRIRHVAPATVLADTPPLEMLRVQYMLETEHGLLTMTFTTPQAARTGEWEQLFDAMASTAELA